MKELICERDRNEDETTKNILSGPDIIKAPTPHWGYIRAVLCHIVNINDIVKRMKVNVGK